MVFGELGNFSVDECILIVEVIVSFWVIIIMTMALVSCMYQSTHEAADQANVQVALVTSLQSLNTNNAETVVRSISTPLKTNMDPEYDGLQ